MHPCVSLAVLAWASTAANIPTYAALQAALQASAASDVSVGARYILVPAALEIPSGHQDTVRANASFATPALRGNGTDRLFRVYGSERPFGRRDLRDATAHGPQPPGTAAAAGRRERGGPR